MNHFVYITNPAKTVLFMSVLRPIPSQGCGSNALQNGLYIQEVAQAAGTYGGTTEKEEIQQHLAMS